jgi:hypothetical protein
MHKNRDLNVGPPTTENHCSCGNIHAGYALSYLDGNSTAWKFVELQMVLTSRPVTLNFENLFPFSKKQSFVPYLKSN